MCITVTELTASRSSGVVDAYMELLFAGLPEQQTGSAMGLSMYAEEMAQKRGEASCGSRQEAAQSHLLVGGMMESACSDGDDNPSVLIALAKGALVMLQQPPMDVTQETDCLQLLGSKTLAEDALEQLEWILRVCSDPPEPAVPHTGDGEEDMAPPEGPHEGLPAGVRYLQCLRLSMAVELVEDVLFQSGDDSTVLRTGADCKVEAFGLLVAKALASHIQGCPFCGLCSTESCILKILECTDAQPAAATTNDCHSPP
eukprot:jgi/Tetstr1/420881/TSEL_011944.t1